jgi:putative MATE family efflux protein
MILMAIASVIGTGASSYISRSIGEGKLQRANQTLTNGLTACIVMGLTASLIGSLAIEPIVHALGADVDTFAPTHAYVFVILLGSALLMVNYALGQLLRAEGAMMPSMLGMFIGTVSNIILDPVFIFGFQLGVTGAAIATVLGNGLGICFYIFCYRSGKSSLQISRSYLSANSIIWKEIFTIGTPSGLNQLLVSIALILCNNVAADYSANLVAGMGISSKIITLGSFIFMGISAGCQPMIGYNYGAQNFQRLQSIVKNGITLTTAIGCTLALLFGVGAPWIIRCFTPLPEVQQAGAYALRITMLSLPFVGSQMLSASTIQAMGKALPGLFLSVARQGLFYIPLLYTLNHLFADKGFLLAQPLSDFITLCISLCILTTLLRKELQKQK